MNIKCNQSAISGADPAKILRELLSIVCYKMSQCVVWEFRCNENMFSVEELKGLLHKLAKKWVFQLEQGSTTDYKHYQGRMSLWKIKRKNELMKLIMGTGSPVFNYLEPTTNAEYKKEAFYCMKEDTRIEGPWKNTDEASYIPKQYREIKLYNWQKEILEFNFDTRHINVLICPKGNIGKSTMCRIGMLKHKAIMLPSHNDGVKLIQSCHNILSGKDLRSPHFVFVDLPRAMSKENLGGLFSAIETIKDGYVYDERNHFKEWWFDSPNIWVFTNKFPETNYLSEDRWRYWTIKNDQLKKTNENYFIEKELGIEPNIIEGPIEQFIK